MLTPVDGPRANTGKGWESRKEYTNIGYIRFTKGWESRKEGAIVLGIGGDNSPWAAGTFFEGVMTTGFSSNATDAAVLANIVAAGYSRKRKKMLGGRGRGERVAKQQKKEEEEEEEAH